MRLDSYFIKSFSVHFFACLIVMAYSLIPKSLLPEWLKPNPASTIIEVSIPVQVDVVDLPKLTLKEQRELQLIPFKAVKEITRPKSEAKVQVESGKSKSEDDPKAFTEVSKDSKKLDSFLSQLQKDTDQKKAKESKVDKAEQLDKKGKNQVDEDADDSLRQVILAGNKLREGVPIGDPEKNADGENTPFSLYAGQVLASLKPYWKLPQYLEKKNLNCRIRLFIAPSGELIRTEIYESSGDADYDQRAIGAITQAAPFMAVPTPLVDKIRNGAIVMGFPL
jgi:colicin import membrane protein